MWVLEWAREYGNILKSWCGKFLLWVGISNFFFFFSISFVHVIVFSILSLEPSKPKIN